MVFTRQKSIADANPESPAINYHEINLREVQTPSRKFFTQEQNELLIQQFVQYAQSLEGEVLYYHILGLNEYSTKDDLKNPIVHWLFDITLIKIIIRRLLLRCA